MILRVASAALLLCALSAQSADLQLKVADKEPPKEINESIRKLLQPKAIQLVDGEKPALEFWLVKELPLQSKPASTAQALEAVKPATLLAAVSVPQARRDYRDDEVRTGIYTMRFALQPQDGNHSGTAEFTYFGVLVPAKSDTTPEGIADYKALVKASSKETSADHPMVVSLRPASPTEGEAPKISEPAPEHKSVRVKVPAKGADTTPVAFEIIYQGEGKH